MTSHFNTLLEKLGLSEFYNLLAQNDIDAEVIYDLNDADLRELGLSLGQRKKFLKAIATQQVTSVVMPKSQAERRQITFVFCDLVGYTALASQLEVEMMSDVLSSYQETCQSVMRAHGGHIAYSQGDGLMVYFGYPNAREDNADSAIRASLAAVEAVSKLKTAADTPLAARVGIATGIVVVGDLLGDVNSQRDSVVGEAPSLAARLQALAAPNEIIVAQETHDLARGGFLYHDKGRQKLKGFSREQMAYRVQGETQIRSRFDLRAAETLGPLLGRDTELAELLDVWQQIGTSGGRLCHISGTAGIGKSRLLRSLQDAVSETKPKAIKLQCSAHLANRAFHPFAREISLDAGFIAGDGDDEKRAKLASFADKTRGFSNDDLPVLYDLFDISIKEERLTADAKTLSTMIQAMLLRWLTGIAEGGQGLLLFEDAHWADNSSRELLTLLVTALASTKAMLVVTFRPEFIPDWVVPKNTSQLDLAPLDDAAGEALIKQVTGLSHLPRALLKEIINKTDGVPLFLEELTKAVVEQGKQASGNVDFSRREALSIPATLQGSLMERLDRLGSGKTVAQLGAVIGREFSLDMLQAVAPPDLEVLEGLTQILDSGLLCRSEEPGDDNVFTFNHALVQDVAYESILISKRKKVHHTLAQVMLNGHPAFGGTEPEVLARHSDLGELPYEAMQNWLSAGRHALRSANYLAAITYLRAALVQLQELTPDAKRNGLELTIQMSLAPACMAIYGWGSLEVEEACSRARVLAKELGDHNAMFGSSWGLWTNYFLRGELGKAMDIATETDAMATAAGVPMLQTAADHSVGYSHFFRGELAEALQRAEQGLARLTDEDETAIIQLFQLSSRACLQAIRSASLYLMGRHEEADHALEESIAYVRDLGHLPSLAYGFGAAGHELVLRCDWDRLSDIAKENFALSREEGFIMWERLSANHIAMTAGQKVANDKAVKDILKKRDGFLETGCCLTDLLNIPYAMEVMIKAGRAKEAVTRLDSAATEAKARVEKLSLAEIYRIRGEAQAVLRNLDAAKADFDRAVETARAQGAVVLEKRAAQSKQRFLAAPMKHAIND